MEAKSRAAVLRACAGAAILASFGAHAARAQDAPADGRVRLVAGDTVNLSLAGAQSLALSRNPAFLADREEAETARGELRQARVYPFNPVAEVQTPGAFTGSGIGEYEVGIGQEIEWAGQSGLRREAAEFGLGRAEYSVQDAARLTLAEATKAFYRAIAARRRLAVAREVLRLNQQLLEAVRVEMGEGEISVMEANLAEIEAGRAEARVLAARRGVTAAELELRRTVGLDPDRPIRFDEEVPDAPAAVAFDEKRLIGLALSRRPDLAARTAAVDQSTALTKLARRERIPNLVIGAVAESERGPGETRFGPVLGLTLPFWNRNQGIVAQRQAETRQATLARRATDLRIRTEVAVAYRAYVAASEEAEIFGRDVLEPARENQRLLEAAYQAGKIDLSTLLLLRNQLLEAELGYWDAWLARREALVDLEAATATLESPRAGGNDDDQR